ncbi:hypothetical protein BDW66DRAFT_153384 [Aspergillus desertorum]
MSSSNHWISLLIEHCLASYETGRDPGLDWEDDGSNIRFSSSDQRLARITEWSEVNDVPRPRLSDLDTQIEAVLSVGSLREYNREYPDRPLSRDCCLGYTIQLDDFELVYEYSAGKPNVHLFVKRFNIVWASDKAKEPPRGKLVTKKPALITLFKRVLSSIRSRHQTSEPSQDTASTVDSSGQNNENGDIFVNGHTQHVQRQFLSQLPRRNPSSPNRSPIHDAVPSGKLLERLGQTRFSKDRQPSRDMSIVSQPLKPAYTPEAVRRRSTSHISTSTVHHGLREKQSAAAAGDRGILTNLSSEPLETQAMDSPSPGKSEKSARETPSSPFSERQSPKRAVERSKSADSPERQLHSQLQFCGNVTPLPISHDKNANSNIVDPWEGMTGISSADVTVPDDQKELLETNPTPWYPPPVGYQVVSGNVPPVLLVEWNELAFQRNQIGDSRPKSLDDDRPATSSTSVSEESGDISIPWSTSPQRTPSRGVLVLPKDSSPFRDDIVRPQRSRSSRAQNILADNPDLQMQTIEEISVPELDGNTQLTFKAPVLADSETNADASFSSMARDDDGHVFEGSGSDVEMASDDRSSDSETNNAPNAEAIVPRIGRDDEHDTNGSSKSNVDAAADADAIATGPADGSSDSDDPEMSEAPNVEVVGQDPASGDGPEFDSSSDSEMSVAIPLPLSGSTQQESFTQEGGVSSSEPPLPESTRQNVQVVKIPAVLSKSRPALSSQDSPRTGLTENQSQFEKSSSQTRILNTYSSHEGNGKGGTSQESSKSLPASAPDSLNRVHEMDTPLSSQAPPTQLTQWSASTSIFVSSEPTVVEGSVAAASIYHSQSSKAFSFDRELPPSSTPSVEDHVSPSMQCSGGAPSRLDRASPLKRFASELDSDRSGLDSDRGSPLKRSKPDHKPTAVKAEGGLDEDIIARHHNYIINSAQSVEAAGIYEKFRGDYPNYAGDYEHFIKLCSRLKSFRDKGSLQRSFLWDDFIIKHLETYPSYLTECHYNHIKPLEYEEYFAETFSKPTYKRRNLDIPGISACAAQVVTIDEPVESREANDAKTSSTVSLRVQPSNPNTHSSAVQDTPSQDRLSGNGQSAAESESASQYSIPDSEPARAAAREHDEDTNINHPQETDSFPIVLEDSDEDSDENMEDAGIDVDFDGTVHETASVELGDDETPTAFPTPVGSRSHAEPLHETLVPDGDSEPASVLTWRRNQLPGHSASEKPAPDVTSKEASDESVDEDNILAPRMRNKSTSDHLASDTDPDIISDTGVESEVSYSNEENEPASVLTPQQNRLPTGLAVKIPTPGTRAGIPSNQGMNKPANKNQNPISNAVVDPNIQEQNIEPIPGPTQTRKKLPAHPSPMKHTPASASGAAITNEDIDVHNGIHNDTTDFPGNQGNTSTPLPDDEDEDEAKTKVNQQEEPEPEEEGENENWFTSLRHVFPTSRNTAPVWADDPHTPFKKWARADQDVFLIRNQRGGMKVPVDERGVIGRIPRKTDTETSKIE